MWQENDDASGLIVFANISSTVTYLLFCILVISLHSYYLSLEAARDGGSVWWEAPCLQLWQRMHVCIYVYINMMLELMAFKT